MYGGAVPSEDVYRAVADPTRRALLDSLREGERSASELGRPFAISQPALSQHLRVLREAGLVSRRRAGRQQLYRLQAGPLAELYDWVAHYEGFWSERFARLHRYLDEEQDR